MTATDKQVKFAMPENYDFHSASAEKVDVKMDTSSQEDIAKGNNQGGTVTNTFDDVPPAVKYWQRVSTTINICDFQIMLSSIVHFKAF